MTHPIADLSFVKDHPKGSPNRRTFWNVESHSDEWEGYRKALEYLAFEEISRRQGGPGHLPKIVADMPRDIGATEIGFLTLISYAASVGRHEALRVFKYWERCAAQRLIDDEAARELKRQNLAKARAVKAARKAGAA